MWWNLFIGCLVMVAVVLTWFLACYCLTPHIEEPDGKGRITGTCGDTMEICLSFKDNKVMDAACWTSGCVYSLNCVTAAGELAKGKTPDEIIRIDAHLIQESIGGLPKDHMHCATLAADTIHEAAGNYIKKALVKRKYKSKHH